MDCRLFSLRSYANNREIHEVVGCFGRTRKANSREIREVSVVSARTRKQTAERSAKCRLFRLERGSKQSREPRSVGCSSVTPTQTTERSTKRRLFRPDADANNRENREASAVLSERGRKQPRNPRSVGCSGRTRKQTADIVHEQRLFRHEISTHARFFSERTIVGWFWR